MIYHNFNNVNIFYGEINHYLSVKTNYSSFVYFQLQDDEFLNLDSILEEVLHLLVIRPLRDHLADLFHLDFQKSGCLHLLSSQMEKVRHETSKTCGKNISSIVSETIASDFPEIDLPNIIQVCKESFVQLEAAFSPAEKLTHLLTGLKQIVNLVS